jgi:acetyl-CoA C-acetyltransferase
MYDIVMVGGVEKMTDLATEKVTDTLATAADAEFEIPAGFTFPGFYAAMATSYMAAYGATPETFMKVSIKNHYNGSMNEKAQFGAKITTLMEARKASTAKKGLPIPEWKDELEFLHDEKANPTIAWPLRLYDCSPISDGAAVVLLVSEELAKNFSDCPIYIAGIGQASDGALHDRKEINSIPSARLAGEKAYKMAGIGPKDIDFAEVHDCFTIAEVIATEDLGFYDRGKGWKAAEDGETNRESSQPINLSGGLKSKGHPVGASGVGQVVEVWKQLRGQAGERQINRKMKYGLTHNVGGTGQTCVVHIFERRD